MEAGRRAKQINYPRTIKVVFETETWQTTVNLKSNA